MAIETAELDVLVERARSTIAGIERINELVHGDSHVSPASGKRVYTYRRVEDPAACC